MTRNPREVRCPWCKAPAGKPCRSGKGWNRRSRNIHRVRKQLAERVARGEIEVVT